MVPLRWWQNRASFRLLSPAVLHSSRALTSRCPEAGVVDAAVREGPSCFDDPPLTQKRPLASQFRARRGSW